MKTVVFKSHEALYEHAANLFTQYAEASIRRSGRFAVLLSGGMTPLPLYRRLAQEPWRGQVDWEKVMVGWSDERCVLPNHAASNSRTAQESLLSHVAIPDDHILRIDGSKDPTEAAQTYEERLRIMLGQDFEPDLTLLGLGSDGHTASLFPANPALRERERWFVPVNRPQLPQPWRITATLPLLNQSKRVVFLVTGQEKAHALAHIRNGGMLPAALVRPQNGTTIWLVDQAASSQSGKKR